MFFDGERQGGSYDYVAASSQDGLFWAVVIGIAGLIWAVWESKRQAAHEEHFEVVPCSLQE